MWFDLFLSVNLFFEFLGTAAPMEALAMVLVEDYWTQRKVVLRSLSPTTMFGQRRTSESASSLNFAWLFLTLSHCVCPHVQVRLDQVSPRGLVVRLISLQVGPAVHWAGSDTTAGADDANTIHLLRGRSSVAFILIYF